MADDEAEALVRGMLVGTEEKKLYIVYTMNAAVLEHGISSRRAAELLMLDAAELEEAIEEYGVVSTDNAYVQRWYGEE